MIAKLSLAATAATLLATAAVADPLRPSMVLPAQAMPGQAAPAPAPAAASEQPTAQEGQDVPQPARRRVPRRSSFFGVPLALLAAGAGVGGAVAIATASPQ